jgi:hypothetical protein
MEDNFLDIQERVHESRDTAANSQAVSPLLRGDHIQSYLNPTIIDNPGFIEGNSNKDLINVQIKGNSATKTHRMRNMN